MMEVQIETATVVATTVREHWGGVLSTGGRVRRVLYRRPPYFYGVKSISTHLLSLARCAPTKTTTKTYFHHQPLTYLSTLTMTRSQLRPALAPT
jgi:hypothetical protein